MSEVFLHYVWKHQYFDKTSLKTVDGESVDVFKPGSHNTDAGPDFKEANVKIEDIEWRGHVEIHHKSSDWQAHGHQHDKAYNGTVLHVVWRDDKPVVREDNTQMPTIELQERVGEELHKKYDRLVKSPDSIPCEEQIEEVSQLTRLSMIDKAVMQRLNRKSSEVSTILLANNNDWEETVYQLLAKSFGVKKNSEPFFELAKSLPFKVLKKHADNPLQLEALLFGQTGFLDEGCDDEYFQKLEKEYNFLRQKYSLEQKLSKHHWKFLRLRPSNFPTVRLAQFASFINQAPGLLSMFLESDIKTTQKKLRSEISDYWKKHYRFGVTTKQNLSGLGKSAAEVICINTVAPVLAAYSKHIDDQLYLDKAIEVLQSISAEKNRIVNKMKETGFEASNAFDSQGLIELHNNFCQKKRCLQCAVGASLVRP